METSDKTSEIKNMVLKIVGKHSLIWLFAKLYDDATYSSYSKFFFANKQQIIPKPISLSSKAIPFGGIYCSNILSEARISESVLVSIADILPTIASREDLKLRQVLIYPPPAEDTQEITVKVDIRKMRELEQTQQSAPFLYFKHAYRGLIESYIVNAHKEFIEYYNLLIPNLNLNPREYVFFISDLYRGGVISSVHTMFWCENCTQEWVIFQSFAGNIDPRSLLVDPRRVNCPCCGQGMHWGTIYEFDESLTEAILFPDGILAVYLALMLYRNEIEYRYSVYEKKDRPENDFIIDTGSGTILIECTMYHVESEKKEDSIKSGLVQKIGQLIDHAKELEDVKKAYLLCNLDMRRYEIIKQDICNHDKFKEDVEKYKVKIIGPNDVRTIIEEIKKDIKC